jgi:uncharacterized membrane protein YqaE (UPF0057 family)
MKKSEAGLLMIFVLIIVGFWHSSDTIWEFLLKLFLFLLGFFGGLVALLIYSTEFYGK